MVRFIAFGTYLAQGLLRDRPTAASLLAALRVAAGPAVLTTNVVVSLLPVLRGEARVLILFTDAFVAGAINSIAGGRTLVTFPVRKINQSN